METSTARAADDPAADFYIDMLSKLNATGIPFLVGGAFAFSHYSHVPRDTKDIDIFVKPDDCARVLEAFERLGYQTEIPFPHWLAKIHSGQYFMDVIFNSGNGVALTGGSCSSGGAANNCTVSSTPPASLSGFSDPSGSSVACSLAHPKVCQYTILTDPNQPSNPTLSTQNFEIVVYLESGSGSFSQGNICINSTTFSLTTSC